MTKKSVANIRELADSIGLSITTVSRVLNGKAEKYRISTKTKERVLLAAKEQNYIPNKIARGLKTHKTGTLGLIIPDIANPFFADIAKSIEMEARSNDLSILLCDSNENILVEKELLNLMQAHKVEGVIIAPVGTDFKHLVEVYEKGLSIVIVDRYLPGINLPYITSDNYQGAFDAISHLISMGHKDIACIQGIKDSQPNKERVKGYIDALEQNNIPVNDSFIIGENFSTENGYKQTRILFSVEQNPTAIFALSNLISLGVIKALSEMGLKIPDDVSLISYDEQPYSAFMGTPLTTIEQKKSEIGQLAVSVITKNIEAKTFSKKPLNMKLRTNLIIRNSVKNLIKTS